MRAFPTILILSTLTVTACDMVMPGDDDAGEEKSSASGDQEILAIGDSFLDYHGPDTDLPYVVADSLEMSLESAAVGGTTMLGGDGPDIPNQYVDGTFDLLIASGGGNDFGLCTCGEDCGPVIDQLISEDGTEGAVPEVVSRAIAGGAKVAWVGYFRPMDNDNEFSACGGELDTYRERLATLDAMEADMVFIDGVEYGTGVEDELYDEDGYHPSEEGSAVLGAVVAATVAEEFGF
jgi:hypothetical protein